MNWSKVLQGLLAVVIAIGGATMVQAVDEPVGRDIPGSPHQQACAVCHNAFSTGKAEKDFNGRNLRHVCVSCHSAGGGASHMPFTEEAMANPYGSTPDAVPLGQGSWRSHNWDAKLVNPKAGARYPLQTYMTYADSRALYYYKDPGTGEYLNTCTRCHRIHDFEPALSPSPGKDLTRLLRDKNDKDQMCNNCHYDWTNLTATQGSHPVKINYTSVWRTAINSTTSTLKYQSYAQYTSSFYKKPRNHNPSNPTSQLSNYYKDGQINCSTCHSVHYGDSDSATFDNRSTANGSQVAVVTSRSFSKSTGMLLRTDQYGADATDVNICTNCHKETQGSRTMTHNNLKNANPQQVQCNHCHRSHTAEDGDTVVNQKSIARTLTYSSSFANAKGRKVLFDAANLLYVNKVDGDKFGGNGICQGCHRVPTSAELIPGHNGEKYPGDHDKDIAVAADCNACHYHAEGFTAAGVCDSCHGYPPPNKAKQLLTYALDETKTPHMVHTGGIAKPVADATKYSYTCVECHFNSTPAGIHNNTDPQNVFVETSPTGSLFGGVPAYNKTARTCNNVYCHSIGAPGPNYTNMTPGNTAQFKQTPSWENGLGKLAGDCNACHGSTSLTLTTGAHAKHLSGGYTCATCHMDTANATPAIVGKLKHANGIKDLKIVGDLVTRQNQTPGVINCTNACHTKTDVANWWVPATGACGTCHDTSASIGTLSPNTISTGSHVEHMSNVNGPLFGIAVNACQVCHVYSTTVSHIDGDTKRRSCNTCHPNSGAIWGDSASATCRSCHVGVASVVSFTAGRTVNATAPVMNSFSVDGHGVAFNSIGSVRGTAVTVDCMNCHIKAKPHIATTDTTSRLPGALAAQNDVCTACHNENWSVAGVVRTKLVNKTHMTAADHAAGTDPTMLCSACHDTHGGGNKRMIRSSIKFFPTSTAANIAFTNPSSGFVQMVYPYRGLCQVCHMNTGHFKRGVPELTGTHAGADHRKCLQCHDHQPSDAIGKMAFAAFADCNGCHGFPPVKSMAGLGVHNNYSTAVLDSAAGYVGGGGAHAVAGHIGKDLTIKNQANANCTNCHNNYPNGHIGYGTTTPVKANIHIVVDQKFRFNATQPAAYNGTTCSNVSCHYATTPTW